MFGTGLFAPIKQRFFAATQSHAQGGMSTEDISASAERPEFAPADALKILLGHIREPLTLVDVGARWGSVNSWSNFGQDAARIICFEPDAEECKRLSTSAPKNVTYLPVALGEVDNSHGLLNITTEPACSSLYRPVESLVEHFPDLAVMKVERTVDVRLRSLDTVLRENHINGIDAIKLDTQGSEYHILKGAVESLRSCTTVDVEVEFNPLYEGQPLFSDVDRLMRENGFVLWRISDLAHYDTGPDTTPSVNMMLSFAPDKIHNVPVSAGQIYWGQAQYVRAELAQTVSTIMPRDSAVRSAAVLGNAGHWRLALHILDRAGSSLSEPVRGALLDN